MKVRQTIKKNPLNDSSCYGSSKRFKYKHGYQKGLKSGNNDKYCKKKDASLPPPIKNRELEGLVLPTNSMKGRNNVQNANLLSQVKNEISKSNVMSEQEILSYMFSSRK
uniref:Uncharacterized protein n=1 Tax=Euplotes harpa TaxID=151035 RepID=A0A7S3JB36_9SPIT|mmetsp:Transcript_27582/g.31755  ORF Transcript_27582/g.31755 Transcript_27582/m.31755 type:complete len:109 (+) Transcript_27582:518-844(+)